jgi:hypothetical protein
MRTCLDIAMQHRARFFEPAVDSKPRRRGFVKVDIGMLAEGTGSSRRMSAGKASDGVPPGAVAPRFSPRC